MGERVDLHIGGYHLTENIGTGGMGSVFRATVEAEGKPLPAGSTVAIKLLHPHLRSIPEFVKRFHREAKLAAALNHPNVVRVLEEGQQDRHHYIVMELADGLKLNDLMGDNQPLSPQQTIEIMNQVCEALTAAAAVADPDQPDRTRSLVHRDIKPDNIIIQSLDRKQFETMTQTGDKTALANIRVKLLDFGLAKDVKALSTVLSQTGQSLGTPAYMSPEQCRGDEVDQRSDIYSLGVVAYHMISGTQPFAGPTTVAYAQQHAEEIPPDILKRNPLCPKNLADCIYRCLAKAPKDRYTSPAELQVDLARVARGQSVAKVYKFKKKGSFSHRKVAAIVAATLVVGALAVAAGWFFVTDRVKANLNDAIQRADVAIAAQDFAGAKKTLEDAIAAVPNRHDKAELTAAASERLRTIAAQAAEQEAARAAAEREAAKRKHEQDAVAAVADIKARTAAGDYQGAIDAASAAIREFADTPSGVELPDLLAAATERLKGQEAAETARQEAERQREAEQARLEAERQATETAARHERFVKYRDEGDAAFAASRFAEARLAYEKALAEQADTGVQARLDTCIERTTRQSVAVIDFEEKGDVRTFLGVSDAGQTVAELVLTRFGQDRYQLIERSQLATLLNEMDLTISVVRDNPERVYGKLKGVRYLVLGRVSRLGNVIVTARMVNVTTGAVVQTAEVSAEDARGLQGALTELARILQMTDSEKKAYLDQAQYPQLLSDARTRRQSKDFDAAVALYQRVLAIRTTVDVQDELNACRAEQTQWENPIVVPIIPFTPIAAPVAEYAKAAGLAASQSLDLGNSVGMKLVLIPAGRFTMGSPTNETDRNDDEGPQRQVTISKAFYMGVYEVTQEQYQAIMGSNPSNFKGAQSPVETMSWNDAQEFCKKLSQRTGRTVRLPTEAEWEYACRAGSTTRFSFGDSDNDLATYAWYSSNSDSQTQPVGRKRPNAFGLYDMHGNVREWCSDWYADSYSGSANTDPQGPNNGTYHVLRGGCFLDGPQHCRSALRDRNDPVFWDLNLGFRVVVEVAPAAASPSMPVATTSSAASLWDGKQPVAEYAKAAGLTASQSLDLGNSVGMKLSLIPAGRFTMGSPANESNRFDREGPQRQVTISRPFHMGSYEVTQEQWRAVMGTTVGQQRDKADRQWPLGGEGDNHPVYYVSWEEATEFCKKLSQRTGRMVRLPTEAEWEYACRAGSTTRFSFGDSESDLATYAWFDSNSSNQTQPVGRKRPNALGLYDMHGNVWEWCSDWYADSYSGAADTDPQGPNNGSLRVLRGGCWGAGPQYCRSARRDWGGPGDRSCLIGFRVVVDLG